MDANFYFAHGFWRKEKIAQVSELTCTRARAHTHAHKHARTHAHEHNITSTNTYIHTYIHTWETSVCKEMAGKGMRQGFVRAQKIMHITG